MKKRFLVTIGDEITTEQELDEIHAGKLFSLIYRGTGFRECEISAKEIPVEQTCGTPDLSKEKMIDLLKRASKAISDYERGNRLDSLDYIAGEIEDYIRENTKGETKEY